MSTRDSYDLFIIGGGINGAGIAADAAGRGLSVILCEQNDLASGTSSASTKLIHGGLRYLEHYDFRLVRKALIEREVLLKKCPNLIFPMEFILPHTKGQRPYWLIRLGLFIYDRLTKRKHLSSSKGLALAKHPAGEPLKPCYHRGFAYADCWGDDSRLVVLNAIEAKQHGATILTQTRCINAVRQDENWLISIRDEKTGVVNQIKARAMINAAGPWGQKVLDSVFDMTSTYKLSIVKGSHIVINKFYSGKQAYILQNTDGRIIFVIPYENNFLLIGTTEVSVADASKKPQISDSEITYLIQAVNHYFNHQISCDDIVHTYAGLRPLVSQKHDGLSLSALSRDFSFEFNEDKAPVLTILGGKITTYRELAEQALNFFTPYFKQMKKPWTKKSYLPGCDIYHSSQLLRYYNWLDNNLANRYASQYGSLCKIFLDKKSSMTDLGVHFGYGLYEAEVLYLITCEWAKSSEDILWRRTKLGLYFSDDQSAKLDHYLTQYWEKQKEQFNEN